MGHRVLDIRWAPASFDSDTNVVLYGFSLCARLDYYSRFVDELSSIATLLLVMPMGSEPYRMYCDDSCISFNTIWEKTGRVISQACNHSSP